MSEVLIFAGTTEGRELACLLSASKIECDVCVAGGYGSSLLEDCLLYTSDAADD